MCEFLGRENDRFRAGSATGLEGGPLRFLWNPSDGGRTFTVDFSPWEASEAWVALINWLPDEVSEYHYLPEARSEWKEMKKAALLTIDEDTTEIRSLLDTLGVRVEKEFLQKRDRPHKVSFLGPGRIDEVKKELEEIEIDLIVINGALKPSQHHYLEMKFQMECMDRPGVILGIFSDHAHTPEAVAQVTLAKLRYELPFLREWIHKAKVGERPGFLAGGRYATDVYFEHAKTQTRKIELRLKELSKQRETTRTKRRASGYSLVSLAGYTNAGKSALMNKMCGSEVVVESKLFSTLSTTTRKVLGIRGNVLMSDTVGFIRDLPPDLINAFNSTLEEIFYADLILLVFDVSESLDTIRSKLSTSLDILMPKVEGRSLVVVANKMDLIRERDRESIKENVTKIIMPYELYLVSATTGEGTETLRERIALIQGHSWLISAELPLVDESYRLVSRISPMADVSSKVSGEKLAVTIKCKPEDTAKILGWLSNASVTKVVSHSLLPGEAPKRAKDSIGSEGVPLYY